MPILTLFRECFKKVPEKRQEVEAQIETLTAQKQRVPQMRNPPLNDDQIDRKLNRLKKQLKMLS